MRFLVAALAALSLTACFGNAGDLLSESGARGERADEARVQRDLAAPNLMNARAIFEGVDAAPPAVDDGGDVGGVNVDPLVAEVAATIDYASAQAYAAADAGQFRDRASAELAAIELANAAALVQQRANELHAVSSTAGEAGGCPEQTPPADGELPAPDGLDEAVVLSALAAELGGEIADTLDPPSELVCGSGCDATCEEVPGTIDEDILALAIEGVLDAAQDCADLGVELSSGDVNAL